VNRKLVWFCLAAALPAARAQVAASATFGEVISLNRIGSTPTPSDIVLDESRQRLYLVNDDDDRVDIFDYAGKQVIGRIPVGRRPLAAAISMDGGWLYVTNSTSSSLTVIDLARTVVTQTVALPTSPQGVEVGYDGRVLVSLNGTVVNGSPQGTLAVLDPRAARGQQLLPVQVPALPSTPAPLPAVTQTRPVTTFRDKLLRTPDGQYIVGVITPSNSSTYVFVYEVASGVVLRNRTTAGQSSVLSMAPDGSRFMTGLAMYDTATLAVLGQMSHLNAPFSFTSAYNTLANIGGSGFSPDGATLYSAFNVASGTPQPSPLASTLMIADAGNLAIRMGIKLPESVVGKMVITADGTQAWGMSDSGLLYLPFARLYEYPIIMPESTTVFLAMDECNRGLATADLRINNLGKGRLTFSVPVTNSALVARASSGVAPATVSFTMEPGRSGIVRRAGTNIWNGVTTPDATNVTLVSPDAVNLPPVIRVYMNYRQPDQRGVIHPIPTVPNSTAEGLQDIVLDERRSKVYITNSGYNRVEVFDTARQRFLNPIPVGQLPHSMALSQDGGTLYVGNTGGESISMVDLDLGRVVGKVDFPPYPRVGTSNPMYARTMAMGLFGLQFVASNGTLWKVVGNQAIPRPLSSVVTSGTTMSITTPATMVASPDSTFIITLANNGTAYLYDSTIDQYTASRVLFSNPIRSYYGVLGAGQEAAYFLANGLILSSSMTVIGGAERPGTTGTTDGQRHVAAVAPVDNHSFARLTLPVRTSVTATTRDDERPTLEVVDLDTGTSALAAVAPEAPPTVAVGNNRFNVQPRMMAVDSRGTVYALTLTGLSVVPLAAPGTDTRPAIASGRDAVVDSNDATAPIRPGSFITINGSNLAAEARADTIPAPTLLGGSCVTFGDISLPLLQSGNGQILGQVPESLRPGIHMVQVRSLATAQASDPVRVTVQK